MAVKPKSRIRKASKGDILQRKGEYNSKIYFVRKGLLRSFAIDKKGREHVFMFAPERWTLGDASAATEPCEFFIDAIEDTEFIAYEKDVERDATVKGFLGVVERLKTLEKRTLMMMSVSALERYEHFEKTYPELVQRVSQRMIASYLGITPEALSKLRGERAKSRKQSS